MSNMSYCRFQNTSKDLYDCCEAVEDLINGKGKLSREELQAAKKLAEAAQSLLGMLQEYSGCEDDEIMDSDFGQALESMNDDAEDSE